MRELQREAVMAIAAFDVLGYARKLEQAGFTREQATVISEVAAVQAETIREQAEAQNQAMQKQAEAQTAAMNAALEKYDEAHRKDLATRGDVRESELRLQKEIRETELRLQKDIKNVELKIKDVELRLTEMIDKTRSTMTWLGIVGWLSLAAIMAKGFHWLGF